MTRKFILAAGLLILAACSPSQPPRLPPATGSVVPQPVIIPGNYVPTGPDDGDNTDDDWAN